MGVDSRTYLYICAVICWICSSLMAATTKCEVDLCQALQRNSSDCSSSCVVYYSSCGNIWPQQTLSYVHDFELLHPKVSFCQPAKGGVKHLGFDLSWSFSSTGDMNGFQVGIARTTSGGGMYCVEMKINQTLRNLMGNISLPCMTLPNVFDLTSTYDVTMRLIPSSKGRRQVGRFSIPGCFSLDRNTEECENFAYPDIQPQITAYGNQSVMVEYYPIRSDDTSSTYFIYISNTENYFTTQNYHTTQTLANTGRPMGEPPHVWFHCVEPGVYSAEVRLQNELDAINYLSAARAEVSKYDVCDGTCQNGGTCIDFGNCTASCTCSDCYFGDNCGEVHTDKNCSLPESASTSSGDSSLLSLDSSSPSLDSSSSSLDSSQRLLSVLLPIALGVLSVIIAVLTVLYVINLSKIKKNSSSKVKSPHTEPSKWLIGSISSFDGGNNNYPSIENGDRGSLCECNVIPGSTNRFDPKECESISPSEMTGPTY